VPVQQADADQRHAEVAARLEVIPGEYAQAAGVLRERGGDAVLRREVSHRGRRPGKLRAGLVPPRACQVLAQIVTGIPEPAQEAPVSREADEALRRHLGQQRYRVLPGPLPAARINRGKKV